MTLMTERLETAPQILAAPVPPDILHDSDTETRKALTLSMQLTDSAVPHFVCIADGDDIEEQFNRTAFLATLQQNKLTRIADKRLHVPVLPLFELGQKDLWSGCGSINMKALFVGQFVADVMHDPLMPPQSKLEIVQGRVKNILGRYAVRDFMLYDPRVGRKELQSLLTR